jgi:hypothetical protein
VAISLLRKAETDGIIVTRGDARETLRQQVESGSGASTDIENVVEFCSIGFMVREDGVEYRRVVCWPCGNVIVPVRGFDTLQSPNTFR